MTVVIGQCLSWFDGRVLTMALLIWQMTNFEHAVRIPMMSSAPGIQAGKRSPALVMEMDLFPTIVSLAELPAVPACPINAAASRKIALCTDGADLSPLLSAPTMPWKQVSLTVAIGRCFS